MLLLYFISLIFIIVIGYMIAALAGALIPVKSSDFRCDQPMEIFVFTNGVHTDIALPVNCIDSTFQKNLNIPVESGYVSFGWGDKEFYINTPAWSDLTFRTAFKALFMKSESAMHVTFYEKSNSDWHRIILCPVQHEFLLTYIKGSFDTTSNGDLLLINVKGYTPNDRFFEAKKSFSLFRTCNVWTNEALKTAKIKTALWSPFDFGIMYHLDSGKK